MRTLLKLVLLVALAFAVWRGVEWFHSRNDLRATLIFDQPVSLQRGDPVVQGEVPIGKISSIGNLDGRPAVTIDVRARHRSGVQSDSLFRIAESPRRLVVDSHFAVGRAAEDGAVIRARDNQLAEWLEKKGSAAAPIAAKMKDSAAAWLDQHDGAQLQRWKEQLPSWQGEGKDSLNRHLEEAQKSMKKSEDSLRETGRTLEADQLKDRFNQWVAQIRKGA